jgi:tetratricopeptide (TPR) repeat protein
VRCTWSRLLLGALAAAGTADAQDPVVALRAAYDQAQALRERADAQPAAVRAAYARALQQFLRLDAGSAEQGRWRSVGAFCALQTARYELAAALYEAELGAGAGEAAAEGLLQALLEDRQLEAFVARARELEGAFAPAVDRVLGGKGRIGDPRLLAAAGQWLSIGRTDPALWVFERAARASGEHPIALANLALALRRIGHADDCERAYRKALAKAPGDHLIWNDLALFYKGAGRISEAAEALAASRQHDPDRGSGPAATNLALLALQHGARPLGDPLPDLARLLAARPDSEIARRVCLDLLLGRFPAAAPDSSADRR